MTRFKRIHTSYLITLEGSDRRSDYLAQILKIKPTRRVIVRHNSGFKSARKRGGHLPTSILEESYEANAVLIMEDDVQFSDSVYERADQIEDFVLSEENDVDAYSLGGSAMLSRIDPFKKNSNLRVYYGGEAHAVIYTNTGTRKLLSDPHIRVLHDLENSLGSRYFQSVPSYAFQERVGVRTENMNVWDPLHILSNYFDSFGTTKTIMTHRTGLPCWEDRFQCLFSPSSQLPTWH